MTLETFIKISFLTFASISFIALIPTILQVTLKNNPYYMPKLTSSETKQINTMLYSLLPFPIIYIAIAAFLHYFPQNHDTEGSAIYTGITLFAIPMSIIKHTLITKFRVDLAKTMEKIHNHQIKAYSIIKRPINTPRK